MGDGIAAEHVFSLFGERLDEPERLQFGVGQGILRMPAAVHEPALVVVAGVPFVHAFENVLRLVYRDDGAFGEDFQLGVGDYGRDFQDDVLFGIEPGHFQVHPD